MFDIPQKLKLPTSTYHEAQAEVESEMTVKARDDADGEVAEDAPGSAETPRGKGKVGKRRLVDHIGLYYSDLWEKRGYLSVISDPS